MHAMCIYMQDGSSVPSVGANGALEGPSDLSVQLPRSRGFGPRRCLLQILLHAPFFFVLMFAI